MRTTRTLCGSMPHLLSCIVLTTVLFGGVHSGSLLAQEVQDAGTTVADPNAEYAAGTRPSDSQLLPLSTAAASEPPQTTKRSPAAKVIFVETKPDIERSEMSRQLVEALEKDGTAERGEVHRIGTPVGLIAILSPRPDLPYEKAMMLIETLKSLGVDRISIKVKPEPNDEDSSVIVQCPADVTWRRVRTITEELEKHADFKVDVRVAVSDEPVTSAVEDFNLPTTKTGSFAPVPENARISPVTSVPAEGQATRSRTFQKDDSQHFPPGPEVKLTQPAAEEVVVFHQEHADAKSVARIIEQLYGSRYSIAVDERTNSVIFKGNSEAFATIEALLVNLDVPTPKKIQGDKPGSNVDKSGTQVRPPAAFGGVFKTHQGFSIRGLDHEDSSVFSFSMGLPRDDGTPDQLRKRMNDLEQNARQVAKKLQAPLSDPATGDRLKSQLRDVVQQTFETRQKLQRAELVEFAQRLKGIQESIELRDKISQQIIDRRVEELVDPNLKWDEQGLSPVIPRTAQGGSIQSQWRVPNAVPPDQIVQGNKNAYTQPDHAPVYEQADINVYVEEVPDETVIWNVMGATLRTTLEDNVPRLPNFLPDDAQHADKWLEVQRLQDQGPAQTAGLQVGDVLVAIERKPVHTLREVNRAWQETEFGGPATLHFLRDGKLSLARIRWSGKILKTHKAEGQVLKRNGEQIEISLGQDDGLHPADRIAIQSKSTFAIMHSAEIVIVQADQSTARIVTEDQRSPIAVGNPVFFGSTPIDKPPREATPDGSRRSAIKDSKAVAADEADEQSSARVSTIAVESEDATYEPRSAAEKAVGKLVLMFFQDKSRQAVPCLALKVGDECFTVTSGPASIVPDGTTPAIDVTSIEWGGKAPMNVEYDPRSTRELYLCRAPADLTAVSLGEVASVQIGHALSALSADSLNRLHSVETTVVATGVDPTWKSPFLPSAFHFTGLYEVNKSLAEGTPLFHQGKFAGLTLLGTRFLGEAEGRSLIVPADRLVALFEQLRTSPESPPTTQSLDPPTRVEDSDTFP